MPLFGTLPFFDPAQERTRATYLCGSPRVTRLVLFNSGPLFADFQGGPGRGRGFRGRVAARVARAPNGGNSGRETLRKKWHAAKQRCEATFLRIQRCTEGLPLSPSEKNKERGRGVVLSAVLSRTRPLASRWFVTRGDRGREGGRPRGGVRARGRVLLARACALRLPPSCAVLCCAVLPHCLSRPRPRVARSFEWG